MKILFKLTSRSRPEKFFATIKNIQENCASDNYDILCTIDEDDESMNTDYVFDHIESLADNVWVFSGESKDKIEANNRDINIYNQHWDILVNVSDDMVFQFPGFDNVIRDAFGVDLDQFIHFNDGNQKANCCTMSIMGRTYYDRFKYVYHPDYQMLWADIEAGEVAKQLGKYKYMGDDLIIFRHMHPAFGLAEFDAQYLNSENRKYWDADEAVYNERKKRNFDL